MVYLDGVFCFFHVGRTGGSSIESLAAKTFNHSVTISSSMGTYIPIHRHCKGFECEALIKDFYKVWKWAVTRNPWEIVNSLYLLFVKMDRIKCGATIKHMIDTCFGGYVECFAQYDSYGKYNIEPIEYNLIRTKDTKTLDYLSKKTHMNFYKLPRLHSSKSVDCVAPWTTEDIDFVAEDCKFDIERFNYTVPKEIYNVIK